MRRVADIRIVKPVNTAQKFVQAGLLESRLSKPSRGTVFAIMMKIVPNSSIHVVKSQDGMIALKWLRKAALHQVVHDTLSVSALDPLSAAVAHAWAWGCSHPMW